MAIALKTPKGTELRSSETLLEGKVFDVRRDRVREPGGIEATREIVVHGGSVVVLPVLDAKRVLLIRQFRYAAGEALWEAVAGHKERDETWLAGARRELAEETGYAARRVREIFDFFPSPGLLTERMVVFLAEGLSRGEARLESDERISTRVFTLVQALRMVRQRKIRDGKTIAALLFFANFAARRKRSRRLAS